MNRQYDLECLDVNIDTLNQPIKVDELVRHINDRLETIMYGDEDSGRRAKINSIVPLYFENNLVKLLLYFEKEEQIGVVFNKTGDETEEDEIYFYPMKYLEIFKVGNNIILEDDDYKVKKVVYDLDYDFILLQIDIE